MGFLRNAALPACLVLLGATVGCSYSGYHTFANTRKLLESDALSVTKVGFAPFVGASDMVASPLTTYMDAAENSLDGNVYLSYLGMQTLIRAEMHPLYKLMAGIMIFPMDTAWFPVAGTVDTIRVLNGPGGVAEDEPAEWPGEGQET